MSSDTEPLRPNPANGKRRRLLLVNAVVFTVIGVLCAAYWFLIVSKREKTDDAYVNGNMVIISAQVAGTVISVLADDTQLVKAGHVLVKLDPTDAETALSRTANALAQTVRQVRQERATADQYDSVIDTRKLELARAESDLAKREPLLPEHAIPAEEVRHARESVEIARAALTQAVRQSKSAHALVDGTAVEGSPAVLQARDVYRDAWIAAQRNAVVAPVTGYVAERSVQLGQHIQAGQSLMTVVPLNTLWVDANFKEVQLRNLRIGQKVEVRSDLYGSSYIYHGRLVGMSAGTGAAFSLLPPQNASGNWIKVVQRVPVRIEIDAADLVKSPLRVGLSATVTVDTTSRSGPVLANAVSDNSVIDTQVYTQDLVKANSEADAIVRRNLGVDH